MDETLRVRLDAAGAADLIDPAAAFEMLAAREGARATLFDRYALESHALGVDELSEPDRVRAGHHFYSVKWDGLEIVGNERRGDTLEVVPYSPEWPERFERRRAELAEVLGDLAIRIDHVGSTSVPGLAAKAIVDIQVSVVDVDDEAGYVPAIESLRIGLRSRDRLHRYFRPEPPLPRDVHVHVCTQGGQWEREHLLFRDYLRAHPKACQEYGELKVKLAKEFAHDRIAYTEMKSEFVVRHMALASDWAEGDPSG